MTISEVKRMARVSEWKGLIQEQKESGMTIRAWCEQNGFRENTYYYWLKIIRAEAIEQVEKNAALLRIEPNELPEGKCEPQTKTEGIITERIMVRINDAVIEFPLEIPVEQIAAFIRALNHA